MSFRRKMKQGKLRFTDLKIFWYAKMRAEHEKQTSLGTITDLLIIHN